MSSGSVEFICLALAKVSGALTLMACSDELPGPALHYSRALASGAALARAPQMDGQEMDIYVDYKRSQGKLISA